MSPSTPEQVWPRLEGFVDAHSSRRRIRERLGTRLGTGGGRVKTLLLLEFGPLAHAAVADALRVDRPYATVIVNQLEELGLASRHEDPEDRRRKLVALTEEGRRVVGEIHEVIDVPPAVLSRLTPAELGQLAAILIKLEA